MIINNNFIDQNQQSQQQQNYIFQQQQQQQTMNHQMNHQHHMINGNEERLELVSQSSPFEEKVTLNGLQKNIRVVIKNSPFNIQLKLKKQDIDLNCVAFESTLLYDCDGTEEKEVDFVKVKPVEHKATPNEVGDLVNIELRIKVLTSQHEDMFFRVKIEGQDPITKEPIRGLYALTTSIKVISKPEQLKKKQPPKKRTWNDILLESVSKIQHQQYEQQKLIEKLLQQQNSPTASGSTSATTSSNGSTSTITQTPQPSSPVNSNSNSNNNNNNNNNTTTTTTTTSLNSSTNTLNNCNNNNNLNNSINNNNNTTFEDSFKQMMNAYTQLDPRQRAEKVRRVFRNASARDSETLSELLDLFITEGVGGPLGVPLQISSPSQNNGPASPTLNSSNQHQQLHHQQQLQLQQQQQQQNGQHPQQTQQQNIQNLPFLSSQHNTGEYQFFPNSFDNDSFNSFGSSSNSEFVPY